MKYFKHLLLASTAGLLLAGAAQAADLPTKKTPPAAPAAASPCSPLLNFSQMHSPVDFFNTPGTLSCYGITLYGTYDVGVGYESHGVPFNDQMHTGVEELIAKNSNGSQFLFTPNGLSQSVIGVKGEEPIPGIGGTSVVFDAETGYDPGTFQLGNGVGALVNNNGVPLNQQNANADSSRAGQIFNSQLYAGVSNTTFGTLTWGRQNTLDLDGINAYDPMGGSYAFSLIGWSGTTAGGGNTEDARSNTAFKYRVNFGQFRIGAMVQTGGFEQGNGAQGLYQFQVGGDFGGLSVDAIYSHLEDAVAGSAYVPAIGGALSPTQLAAVNAQQLTATLSDNDSVTLLAKYKWNSWTLYGGYEHIDFNNPTTDFSMFRGINGYTFSNVTNNAYGSTTTNSKQLQIMWTGAKYSITPDLDITGAYYHIVQNSYYIPAGHNNCNNESSHGQCAGTEDVASAMVDWRFWKHVDTYAGVMFSEVNGGMSNGFLNHTVWAPTAGLRIRF
ncbi:MAG TPA: porin [Roseiarcus sp.]|jgi:predicted porin